MSIRGNSFTGGSAGPHLETAVGAAGGIFTGAHTLAFLVKLNATNIGFFAGWSDSYAGTDQGGLQTTNVGGSRLFGKGDFSGGFGPPLNDGGTLEDNQYRWFCLSKPAGSTHYRFHVCDLATLTWTHGESSGSGNHGNQLASVLFSIGFYIYPLGNLGACDLAAGSVWGTDLSAGGANDAGVEAALTQAAIDLAAANPLAGWLFKQADFGSPYVDFTGGGATETTRVDLIASADPTLYDFSLLPPAEGSAAFTLDLALAGVGGRNSEGIAALDLSLAVNAASHNPADVLPLAIYRRPGPVVATRTGTLVYRRD